MRGIYIAIEGPIGVGKTALARLIQPYFNAQLLLEVFEENPFLEKFYQDRERYAFQTELFFLLNRYHQQQEIVSDALTKGNLISDYTFVKNKLFASLNLRGEELNLYEQLYRILSQKIIAPNLICLLQASTDVLMERIAFRDRPYERNMDRDYIHRLRIAYDEFFSTYDESTVLRIETDELNFIRKREDLELIVGMINSALKNKTLEKPSPSEGGK